MNRKWTALALVVVLGASAVVWWYKASRTSAESLPQIVTARVERGDVRVTISGSGPVASVNGVQVKASQAGTVAKILAQDGDRVKAGQVILELASESLAASLRQAQIDLENARADLENLVGPEATAVRMQELKVESARLTLQQRKDEVDSLAVRAPVRGVVQSVKVTEGSDVAGGALLFTIFDDLSPSFTVQVPQAAAAAIEPGQRATVALTGWPSVEGTVRWVGGSATPSGGGRDATVPVSVALPPMPGVRAGMVGQASMQVKGLTFLVQGAGSIENDAVEVRAKVAGTAVKVAVKEGDRVEAGDLLAELKNDNLLLQLRQAEGDLKVQEQTLRGMLDASDPGGQLRQRMSKVEQARAALESRQAEVDELKVKAPVDGVISGLSVRVGDKVSNNQALFRVADYGQMQVTISVDELDIAKARVGQRVQIRLDALPGRVYEGTVTKINPEGVFKNDIATFEVTVGIERPEGLLAGMNATVEIVVDERKDVLFLPAQAVRVRGGRAFVMVMGDGGTHVEKEIQIGIRTSQRVEVTGGLKEGDEVIQTIVRPQARSFGLFGPRPQQQNQPTFSPNQPRQTQPRQRQGQRQGGR